jgi:hypothetical protein
MLEAGLMNFAGARADLMRLDTRPSFANSNIDCASALQSTSGLPSSDEQKKTRLLSHLSA